MGIETKKELIKKKIAETHGCSGSCAKCTRYFQLVDKMQEANIPAGYWLLNMRDFKGSQTLADVTKEYTESIQKKYMDGKSICFSGTQGTGKTMSAVCILKAALKNNFTVYYITASDLLGEMTSSVTSHALRQKLKQVDFLVIDELDSRFFVSNSVKELFSGIYENIFRTRAHNMLPTIMCSNETDGILNVFYGQSKHAINSLWSQYVESYMCVGKDFRDTK